MKLNIDARFNIDIGHVGEYGARPFEIDIARWITQWPDGLGAITIKRPGDAEYYVAQGIQQDNDKRILVWTPDDRDTAIATDKKPVLVQVVFAEAGTVVAKSPIWECRVHPALSGPGDDPPASEASWVTEVLNAAQGITTSVTAAASSASAASASASEASGSATSASGYSDSASASATEAARQAGLAAGSASAASGYADAAAAKATLAEGSVSDASSYADAASGYADAASGYADTAAGYIDTASGYADDSSDSALVAEGYSVGTQNGVEVGDTSPYYQNNAKYYAEHASIATEISYEDINDKPSINSVTLNGAMSLEDLGIAAAMDIPDISGKADKVSNGTSGNFAALDANGNLTDSGHKHADYLTSHQDISGKADKVSGATNNNFAALDANGNLKDSGKKASDFATQSDISGFYTKPSGGIPASDLASGVIPDVSGFYTKPVTGIPASDLASGVIPTVHNVPSGGTSGQILAKSSSTDYAMSWVTPGAYLPSVSSSDNGKVLRVVNGAWSAVQLPSASGVSF